MELSSYIDASFPGLLAYHEACAQSNLRTVHTSFSFRPATTQLSSQEPNVQVCPNQSKYGQLATRFRTGVEAPKGYTLVEADYRSFHVLTLGYEAQDADYIRLARLDTHSFLAAQLVGANGCGDCLNWPDPLLAQYLKAIKKVYESVRNGRAKPGILGYGFGMGAGKLYDLNQESFSSFEEAKHVIDMLNACFPKTAEYRQDAPELAHRQKVLINKFGACRWFMNVKSWDAARNTWRHGKDWEKAIAFRPASNAFAIIKLAMLRLKARGLADKYNMINNIHDALLFCCPDKYLEECLDEVRLEMQRPCLNILHPDGSPFWCEVEAKTGPTWANMIEHNYPKDSLDVWKLEPCRL